RAEWAHRRGKFPLLVKLLDAHRKLSVQVHPDDAYAQAHEGNELGKSEMWFVLHADPGAAVILGLRPGATPAKLRAAAKDGSLSHWLHEIPVEAGDFVCVPAGSLHAILGGLLIAEIQQNSDTTYRVFDWNRTGKDGQSRPLHLDEALDVINFEQVEPPLPTPRLLEQSEGVTRFALCQSPYFVTERIELEPGAHFRDICNGATLQIWGTLSGRATVEGGAAAVDLPAVTFTLLPAALGPYTITANQSTHLLRTYLP
ncbi:MAG: type I phosphomannose isomerase catalytic subunit, partial [Candidatus Promineifilaceae bacterium]|nr:type I phosphomannose isomerase catalytic subunit [Candidatus Promineifilaceae bacterium]